LRVAGVRHRSLLPVTCSEQQDHAARSSPMSVVILSKRESGTVTSVPVGPHQVDAAHARITEHGLEQPAPCHAVLHMRLVAIGAFGCAEHMHVAEIDAVGDVLADLDPGVGLTRAGGVTRASLLNA